MLNSFIEMTLVYLFNVYTYVCLVLFMYAEYLILST